MHHRYTTRTAVGAILLLLGALSVPAQADQFTKADEDRWFQEFMSVVERGDKLFHGGLESENAVACAQCHPNAANTHPETYPKFQQQLGKVIALWEMVNWCIINTIAGEPLAADDARMIALQAYMLQERKGIALAPGKH